MRISTQQFFQFNVNSMQQHAASVSKTQAQLSSGLKLLMPADDPNGATRILGLEQRLATLEQYDRNTTQLENNLRTEEAAVEQIHSVLDNARERLIQINNGPHTQAEYKTFGGELAQMRDQLRSLGNTQNANGEFMFAGTATDTQPFTRDAGSGYQYQGNQQTRDIPVAAGRTIAYGDSGFDLFVDIFTGNQGVTASADTANSGDGVIGYVGETSPGSYFGDHLRVVFNTPPDTYDLVDVATVTTLSAGVSFTPGDTININGVSATLDGAPAAGDKFDFQPSQRQNLLTTFDALVSELQTADSVGVTRLHNAINRGLENIDAALEQSIAVRSRVGTRLESLDAVRDANQSFEISYQATLSEIRDLDYNEAAARLSAEVSALEIAQASFARVQNLSLFNYL